jgi:hypothetical protein
MNKLGLVALFGLGLSGCAAKYQSLPPTEGVALTIKNEGAAAMTNIHTNESCAKLPNGDWLGSIGEMKISSMSEYQKTVYVAPNEEMTLDMEWYDLGVSSGDCVQTATFTPMKGYSYFAEYLWSSGSCKLLVAEKSSGDDEFNLLDSTKVKYGDKHCSH